MPPAASLASLPLVSPGALVSSSDLAGLFTQASLGASVSTTPSTGGSSGAALANLLIPGTGAREAGRPYPALEVY